MPTGRLPVGDLWALVLHPWECVETYLQQENNMKKGVDIFGAVFALILILSASSTLALDHSGSITTDETWYAADNPHVITSSTTLTNDAVLMIQPGVEIRFNELADNPRLIIGEGNGGTGGKLIAQGTDSEKILFTSNATTPQPGDWTSIVFSYNASDKSLLDHVIIEYGGGSGTYGSLDIYSTNPTITNCIIRKSSGYGLDITSSSPKISCCDITLVQDKFWRK
jgi:hypothetical protein